MCPEVSETVVGRKRFPTDKGVKNTMCEWSMDMAAGTCHTGILGSPNACLRVKSV